MALPQDPGSAPAQPSAPQPAADATAPNQYHLHGGGIAVSYFPEGAGPLPPGGGARFIYQDAQRSLNLTGQQIRTVSVDDLGTVVSISLAVSVDTGFTSFSLLVPQVVLSSQSGAVPIHTDGITTVHRTFLGGIGQAQRETYTVTKLVGTASRGILPT